MAIIFYATEGRRLLVEAIAEKLWAEFRNERLVSTIVAYWTKITITEEFFPRPSFFKTVIISGSTEMAILSPFVSRAIVVAQLAERSLLAPEICSSDPNISNEIFQMYLSANCYPEKMTIKKKRPGMAHCIIFLCECSDTEQLQNWQLWTFLCCPKSEEREQHLKEMGLNPGSCYQTKAPRRRQLFVECSNSWEAVSWMLYLEDCQNNHSSRTEKVITGELALAGIKWGNEVTLTNLYPIKSTFKLRGK